MKSSQQLRLEMCWSKNRVAERIIKEQEKEIKKLQKEIEKKDEIIENLQNDLDYWQDACIGGK